MLEQLKYLVELQILEDKKSLLVRSSDGAPRRLTEIEEEFQAFEEEYLSKKADYDNAKKMHRTLEQSIGDLESKIARSKQRMGEVKTNKEYQAMLKEIEDIKSDIGEREDKVLEVMEGLDSLGKAVKELEREREARRTAMEQEKAALLKENARLKERLDRLEAVQEKVRHKMEPFLLKRCEFLFLRLGGIGVAAVENGVCQVCHLNIPPQKFIELQRDESIMQCPHCHRFIYWPGHDVYNVFEEDLDGLES